MCEDEYTEFADTKLTGVADGLPPRSERCRVRFSVSAPKYETTLVRKMHEIRHAIETKHQIIGSLETII